MSEAVNIAEQLKEQMDKLMLEYKKTVATLPTEQRKHLTEVNNDINSVLELVKKGDLSSLQHYIKKYAGTDSHSPIL